MKRLFLFIIFLTTSIGVLNAQLKSEVRECFELTSIVFRLAGAPEYVNNQLQNYTSKIDHYFAPYTDDPFIVFLKKLREEYGISYNAVSTAAACLVIKDGNVMVNPAFDASKIGEFDGRWTEEAFTSFVSQLNDFYSKTDFRDFYLQHTDLYDVATGRMDQLLKTINLDWFKLIFGEELGDIEVIVSLCNGSSNYAFGFPAEIKGLKDGIVLGAFGDQEGLPRFVGSMITTIIHELLHHYTNRRINQYWDQIEVAAEKIYPYVKEEMSKNAYGNVKTTMVEWFNNLCEVMYIQDNPGSSMSFEQLTGLLEYRGFIWMGRSVQFMKHFFENRDLFVTIDDYMPQIVAFLNFTADNFDQVVQEYSNRLPYILDVFPAPGSTILPDIYTVEIRFSQQMSGGSYGMDIIDDETILPIPLSEEPFWKDEYTFVISLDPDQLEKGKRYGLKLLRTPFQSKKMFSIKEDYIYTFITCEK